MRVKRALEYVNFEESCHVIHADSSSPVKSTWLGGTILATDRAALKSTQVTRQEYHEHGSSWLARVFAKSMAR